MLNIYGGKKSCGSSKSQLLKNSVKSFQVMCGEILENTYSNQNQESLNLYNSYRKQIKQLRNNFKI